MTDDPWDDGWRDEPVQPLTRDEARVLEERLRPVSPWRVVRAQMVVGVIVALVAGLVTGTAAGFWSALYGAAVVVVPAALMARGMTSPLSSVNPMTSAFSYGVWQAVKIGASVLLLWAAPKLVPMLSWPALLAGLVVCIKVYWVALSWHEPR